MTLITLGTPPPRVYTKSINFGYRFLPTKVRSSRSSCTTPVVGNMMAKKLKFMRNGASPVILSFLKLDLIATKDKCADVFDVMVVSDVYLQPTWQGKSAKYNFPALNKTAAQFYP